MSYSNAETSSIPHKVVNWLFGESNELSLNLSEWMQLLSATLLFSNESFLQEFYNILADKLAQADDEATIYSALSYLAFSNPQAGAQLKIRGIAYTLEKIPLTSAWISAPYYAYGLKAEDDQTKPSILIFQGTTYPTDNGFLAGLLADTVPYGAIGTSLYYRGQECIQQWINNEYTQTGQRVMCTGQSLGGAMSLHCMINQSDKVQFVVFNPPTLTARESLIIRENNARNQETDGLRSVYSHVNDPVFSLGNNVLPLNSTIHYYGNTAENPLFAHARAPEKNSEVVNSNNLSHSQNILWQCVRPFLFMTVVLLHILALPLRLLMGLSLTITECWSDCTQAKKSVTPK